MVRQSLGARRRHVVSRDRSGAIQKCGTLFGYDRFALESRPFVEFLPRQPMTQLV
jgi:hypothetical protein